MAEAIDAPEEMSIHAPRIITIKVPVDKIGEVIGPKGKIINQIQDDTGATLSIEDDGTVYIGATNGEAAQAAKDAVNAIANPTMPEVGERYLGTVVKTTNFGAFVSLMPGKDGLLHISKLRALAGGKRVDAVEDVLVGRPEDPGRDRRDRRPRQAVAGPGRRGRRRRGCRRPRPRRRASRPLTPSDLSSTSRTTGQQAPAGRSCAFPCESIASVQNSGTTRTLQTVKDADGQVTSRVRRTVLPSGLRIVTEQMAGARSASIGVWVGVGSRDETPALHGCSHFLEHLLFKGTRERTALDISVALDAVGGEFNAFTAKEYTCFHARVLDDDLPLAVDVLGDMITNSLITAADVEAERDVILDEIAMHDDDPDDVVHNLFAHQAWGDSPLGRPIAGTDDSITAMTRDQVAPLLPAPLPRRDNMVVAVGRQRRPRHVVRHVRRAFARQGFLDGDGTPVAPPHHRPRPAPSRRGSRAPRAPSSRSTSCSG